jgi:hypothetical protein
MPAQYDRLDIRFLYPDNWTVEEDLDDWPHEITVQSPGSAYWELQVYPTRLDPEELAAEVLRAMQAEYKDLESQPIAEDIGPWPVVGYNLSFFCLDLLIAYQFRCLCVAGHTYLLIYQAEDREFERQQLVFEAMTRSLLAGGPASEGTTE